MCGEQNPVRGHFINEIGSSDPKITLMSKFPCQVFNNPLQKGVKGVVAEKTRQWAGLKLCGKKMPDAHVRM